jgi:phosphohistidine phosphatase
MAAGHSHTPFFGGTNVDLYLIRHADAVSMNEKDVACDADRPLSDEGEEQASHLAAGLQRKGVRVAKVLTSPLLRARQTAEGMLHDWAPPAPQLIVCDELTPGTKPRKLARVLRELTEDSVALVGHQPDLGEWAAWLIGSKKAQIDVAKAGVIYVQSEDPPMKGSGTLIWLVTHEWLTV